MSQDPHVSVLMTSYNRAEIIGDAIESVLASTFGDFELILTDDGSTDGTQDVIREYARADERVKLHQNETNLGDYPNRNHAASLARGEWLKYVDSDDYIYPTGLQVLVDMMSQHPEAGYGLCSIYQFTERPFPIQLSPREAYLEHYFGRPLFHKAPLSAIIRRSAFERVGGFTPARMIGDMDMWHRLSVHYPVVLMPLGVVWYRIHEGQETALREGLDAVYRPIYEQVIQRMLADPNVPLTLEEKKTVRGLFAGQNWRLALRRLLSGKFGEAYAYSRHARSYSSVQLVAGDAPVDARAA